MAADHRGIGLGGRDDLEQPQVARRIEEMRAEPVAPEIVATALGQRGDRNAGRVRADDRPGPALLVDPREQLLLDVEPLDDRFHDPVGLGDAIEIGVEAAGGDELVGVGRELRIGLQLARLLESLPREVGGQVEQQRRDAGVGAVQRDLRAHRAGAEHGDRVDRDHRFDAVDEQIDHRIGLRRQSVLAPAQHPVGRHLVERAEEDLGRRSSR